MLSLTKREEYLKSFSAAEANFRLESMDPSGDHLYEASKAAILAGEMTLDEAIDFVLEGSVSELQPAAWAHDRYAR